MGELFNLRKQLAFYGSYHANPMYASGMGIQPQHNEILSTFIIRFRLVVAPLFYPLCRKIRIQTVIFRHLLILI